MSPRWVVTALYLCGSHLLEKSDKKIITNNTICDKVCTAKTEFIAKLLCHPNQPNEHKISFVGSDAP